MNFRNAKYNAFGTIDCEINHPVYGWIPFTADPNDMEPIGVEVFNAAKATAATYVEPPVDLQALAAQASADRIAELQQLLADTDYVALRDYDKSKPEVLAQRQAWRDEIRELEA